MRMKRHTLDPPLAALIRVQDELDGGIQAEFLLQHEEMILPRQASRFKAQDLTTLIHLKQTAYGRNLIRYLVNTGPGVMLNQYSMVCFTKNYNMRKYHVV
jgi:hypothetical protein